MINVVLSLLILCSPVLALTGNERNRDLEEIKTIFGSNLEQDLVQEGFSLDEACRILRMGLAAQQLETLVVRRGIDRSPELSIGLPVEWDCFVETESQRPLIICPKDEEAARHFLQVAEENQTAIVAAIEKYGSVVFSGFGFKLEDFPIVFFAATGVLPEQYQGDTPREEVVESIYKSTAVAPAHHLGLHQEEAALGVEHMPKFISFYCELPPEKGTGQTLVASAREITQSIQIEAPDLWELMNQKLTSWSFYMPDTGFWTRITKYFNPSHATVTEMFGTDDPEFIEAWCKKRGCRCLFVDGGVKIFRPPVPGVIQLDGESIFCNQIHLSVRNAHLCGGEFNKSIADCLL